MPIEKIPKSYITNKQKLERLAYVEVQKKNDHTVTETKALAV